MSETEIAPSESESSWSNQSYTEVSWRPGNWPEIPMHSFLVDSTMATTMIRTHLGIHYRPETPGELARESAELALKDINAAHGLLRQFESQCSWLFKTVGHRWEERIYDKIDQTDRLDPTVEDEVRKHAKDVLPMYHWLIRLVNHRLYLEMFLDGECEKKVMEDEERRLRLGIDYDGEDLEENRGQTIRIALM